MTPWLDIISILGCALLSKSMRCLAVVYWVAIIELKPNHFLADLQLFAAI